MSASNEAKEQRQTQILQAVCRCLHNKPSAELTIKDVANEAGISYGLVHFYFGNKEKLLIETARYVMKYSEQVMLEELAPYLGRPLSDEEILQFFDHYHRRLFFSDFSHYQEVWYDLSTQNRFSEGARNAAAASYGSYKTQIAEPLGRILSQGKDYELVYNLIMTFMEGMHLRVLLYGYDPEKEIENGKKMLGLLLKSFHSSP